VQKFKAEQNGDRQESACNALAGQHRKDGHGGLSAVFYKNFKQQDSPGMERLKILILEDDLSVQNLYRKAFADEVFEQQYAANGKEGLKLYGSWKPDIILLDIYMPVMTGFLVLKEIRSHLNDSATVIIMQTSLARKDDIMQCIALGIQGYIVKPFDYRTVADTVLKYYATKNPERAQAAQDALAALRAR